MRSLYEPDNIRATLIQESQRNFRPRGGSGLVTKASRSGSGKGPRMAAPRSLNLASGFGSPESAVLQRRDLVPDSFAGTTSHVDGDVQVAPNGARLQQVASPDDYIPKTAEDCQRVYDNGVLGLLRKNEDLMQEKSGAYKELEEIGKKLDSISKNLITELGIDVAKTAGGALLAAKEGHIGLLREIIEGLLEANAEINDYYGELQELDSKAVSIESTINGADTEIETNTGLIDSSNGILEQYCEGRYVSYPV